LIADADRYAVLEMDFNHLLAVNRPAFLVRQRCNDFLAIRVDNLSRRWIGKAAVEAERHPAWLVAQRDALHLLGRVGRQVENVDLLIVRIAQPELLFVRREPDAMAGSAVTLNGTPF